VLPRGDESAERRDLAAIPRSTIAVNLNRRSGGQEACHQTSGAAEKLGLKLEKILISCSPDLL